MQIKKLLGSSLALAMLFPAGQANAEVFNNLKFSGELDIQSISARNITDFATRANDDGSTTGVANNQDRMGATQTRTMVRMDWDLLDDVHSRISLSKNNRYWGTLGTGQGETLDTVQSNIRVDEANVKIDKLAGDVNATFGRQYYGTPGDMIAFYGPLMRMGFGMGVRSLDAARFDWAGEHMNATVLLGKPDTSGASAGIATSGSTDIRAIILGCTKHENVTGNVYLWNKATHNAAAGVGVGPNNTNAGGKNDNLYVAGIKAKAKMGALWFGGEFAKNFGTQRVVGTPSVLATAANYTGMAIKADAGYKAEMEGTATFEPWGQFALGTGRVNTDSNKNEAFQAINPNYLPGSIWGRFTTLGSNIGTTGLSDADALPNNDGSLSSIRNKVIWGVGVKTTPASLNKLTVGLSWWNFRLHRIATSSKVTTQVANGNKNIGSEADLDLTWKHSQNVTLGLGAATFQPGGLIKETQRGANAYMPNNPATMAYMDLRINWGGWSAKN